MTAPGKSWGHLVSELYAVGWRVGAGRVARGYAVCDGGGQWRVYGTRVAAVGDGPVEVVLGRRLADGLETHRQD